MKIFRWLSTIWLILGMLMLGFFFYGYVTLKSPEVQKNQSTQVTHSIISKKKSQEEQAIKKKKAVYDDSAIEPVKPEEYAQAQLNYEKLVNYSGIGAIYIPSSNIHSKILAGMTNENLMVGLGTYYQEQTLGKGNYVLMAHNLMQGGGVLANLPETVLGSVVYATDFSTIYEYVVTLNQIVNQSEGDLLNIPDESKTPIMTIFRCEGGLHTPNRSLIQAEYKRSYPASKGTKMVNENLGLTMITTKVNTVKNTVQSESTKGKNSISEAVNTGTRDSAPTKAPEKEISQSMGHDFVVTKPIYSFFQKFSILVFQIINKSPALIVTSWLGGIGIFEIISYFGYKK
ncbi:class A sortase [Enterococcus faecium]|uniref:class A sortase n=1 Tax=Enterococcus faecium TaxID=1352 RepID=UPI00081318D1|nr:class A sortase [Enterococcus faecium]